MERGLYIAASGMLAEQVRQDQIANDLANASTPGYKPDTATQHSFGALLLDNTATGQPVGTLNTGKDCCRSYQAPCSTDNDCCSGNCSNFKGNRCG